MVTILAREQGSGKGVHVPGAPGTGMLLPWLRSSQGSGGRRMVLSLSPSQSLSPSCPRPCLRRGALCASRGRGRLPAGAEQQRQWTASSQFAPARNNDDDSRRNKEMKNVSAILISWKHPAQGDARARRVARLRHRRRRRAPRQRKGSGALPGGAARPGALLAPCSSGNWGIVAWKGLPGDADPTTAGAGAAGFVPPSPNASPTPQGRRREAGAGAGGSSGCSQLWPGHLPRSFSFPPWYAYFFFHFILFSSFFFFW